MAPTRGRPAFPAGMPVLFAAANADAAAHRPPVLAAIGVTVFSASADVLNATHADIARIVTLAS